MKTEDIILTVLVVASLGGVGYLVYNRYKKNISQDVIATTPASSASIAQNSSVLKPMDLKIQQTWQETPKVFIQPKADVNNPFLVKPIQLRVPLQGLPTSNLIR